MNEPPEDPDKKVRGILIGIAFILFSAFMAGWHWLLTGINEDFGTGALVGFTIAVGLMAICLRSAREL